MASNHGLPRENQPSVSTENIEFISKIKDVSMGDSWYEFNTDFHFWFQWRLMAMLRQFRRLNVPMNEELKVLEVGSGTGLLRTQVESATNWIVDGADLNVHALSQARRSRGKNMLYDVLDEYALFVEAYDIVIVFDILEHIDNTKPFLTSVLRHVAPGGLVLLNVPALQTFYSTYDESMGHIRRYEKKTLSKEFKDLNFEIEDMCYWGMSMLPLLVVRKLMMTAKQTNPETIKAGFSFPGVFGSFPHVVLRAIARMETTMFSKPPLGTSLLMVGRKH